MAETGTRRERFHGILVRWRWAILGAVLLHCVVVHYFFFGYVSWDGYAHRMQPIIELVKHGAMNLEKFDNAALVGFRPFVELIHAPFLAVFGLDALYIAFPVTFPLFARAIHHCVREAAEDDAAALYAAGTYVLVPVVSSQLFSGYIDWAIPALLAYFVYALLAAARDPRRLAPFVRVAFATFLFTMSRQQAPYVSVLFVAYAVYARFVERSGWRFTIAHRKRLAAALLAYALGLAPAAFLQLATWLKHGSPIHPFELSILGLRLGKGLTYKAVCWYGGLRDYTPRGFFRASYAAWIAPAELPYAFFDSRYLGGGLFFLAGVVTAPLWWRRSTRAVRLLVATLLFVSLAVRDFWLPRYASALLLAVCIANALALAALLRDRRRPMALAYATLVAVAAVHVFRPEWEIDRAQKGAIYARLNASQSRWFVPGSVELPLYPDANARLVLLEGPTLNFAVPLYGRKLTNEVVTSVPPEKIGEHCEGLRPYLASGAPVLFVDDHDHAAACKRTCALPSPSRCLAFTIEPPPL